MMRKHQLRGFMAITISDEYVFEGILEDLISSGFNMIYLCDEYCGVYVNNTAIVAEFYVDPVTKRVIFTVMPGETKIQEILDTYDFEALS